MLANVHYVIRWSDMFLSLFAYCTSFLFLLWMIINMELWSNGCTKFLFHQIRIYDFFLVGGCCCHSFLRSESQYLMMETQYAEMAHDWMTLFHPSTISLSLSHGLQHHSRSSSCAILESCTNEIWGHELHFEGHLVTWEVLCLHRASMTDYFSLHMLLIGKVI